MTNYERVMKANLVEFAKIIESELCGMCHCCTYMYTTNCRYDKEVNTVNPNACEKGIAEWLNKEVN